MAHCLERRKLIARTIRYNRWAFRINAMRQNGQDGIFVVALGRPQPPPWRELKGAEIITGERGGDECCNQRPPSQHYGLCVLLSK